MNKIVEISVAGMTCDGCARHVQKALTEIEGVDRVEIDDWRAGSATVFGDSDISPSVLTDSIRAAGYGVDAWKFVNGASASSEEKTNDSDTADFDLVIIGGGSAAFAAAIKTSELGGKAVIINDGLPIGGTCVNVGCVPSKTMIRAAESNHVPGNNPFKGIESNSKVTDFSAITGSAQDLVSELRQGKYVDVVADDPNITIVNGRASIVSPHFVVVDGITLSAKNILIATGARTFVPEIPGLHEIDYLTNENLYTLDTQPVHLIVLGGRYIGLENAQLFARLDCRVTVLQRSGRILPDQTEDLTSDLTKFLVDDGVDVRTGVSIISVTQNDEQVDVEIKVGDTISHVRGSHLLVATGRQGNTEDLGLEALGISTHGRGYLEVDDHLKTSVPTIFGAGDVLGERQFVYTAAYEGSLVAKNAFVTPAKERDYTALPWVVFTDPQVAGIGMDEMQAEDAGIPFEVSKIGLEYVPRSIAARDTRGFVKLIRNPETDLLIGARILAPEGSELLMEITLAIKFGITVKDLVSTFHPYLTLSESIKLAAISFGKDVTKLSCCAA